MSHADAARTHLLKSPSAVLPDPSVPEAQRWCENCGGPVGRSRLGRAARTRGHCPRCGHPFRCEPRLAPGEVVHGQYEVAACLARGGTGWVHLAVDRAVADRWVVLKSVRTPAGIDGDTTVVDEQRVLAGVEHPNIVEIHNYVRHPDPDTGFPEGYLVMEYLSGPSLMDIARARRAELGPGRRLPVAQGLAYVIELLEPLGHLHDNDLLHCDVKPANVVQADDGRLKLIDLGSVRTAGDTTRPVFGTTGYQAPELTRTGPSVAADLYSVGRTLAVLTVPFDFQGRYRDELPPPSVAGLLGAHDSFHRALARATAASPARRFTSARQMREQLAGVRREILAETDGEPRSGESAEFEPEAQGTAALVAVCGPGQPPPEAMAAALPLPRVRPDEPGATLLASAGVRQGRELVEYLEHAPEHSWAVAVRLILARVAAGGLAKAMREVRDLRTAGTSIDNEVRGHWVYGVAAIAAGHPEVARRAFGQVLDLLPGELAPKLALACCAELAGDGSAAARLYQTVWRTDRKFPSACFGLARSLVSLGQSAHAEAVLATVPPSSPHYAAAQAATVRYRISTVDVTELDLRELTEAARLLGNLALAPAHRAEAEFHLLSVILDWLKVPTHRRQARDVLLLGRRLRTQEIRRKAIQVCRKAAGAAVHDHERTLWAERSATLQLVGWW